MANDDSPSIRINNRFSSALFYACTDTWVLGVILLCLFTLGYSIYALYIGPKPEATGGPVRLALLNGGIWMVSGLVITRRFLTSYAIARHGYYVLGKVINHEDFGFGKNASTRLNVSYIRGGQTYLAKTSVFGRIPEEGSDILVAVHRDKPGRYRVLPYDYLMFKWARAVIIEKVKST